jgi:hypothetical protein
MVKSNIKQNTENEKSKILTVEINVANKLEAYKAVADLAFSHKLKGAKFEGHKETFDDENTPFHFLKNNKKNNKTFRDVMKERGLK